MFSKSAAFDRFWGFLHIEFYAVNHIILFPTSDIMLSCGCFLQSWVFIKYAFLFRAIYFKTTSMSTTSRVIDNCSKGAFPEGREIDPWLWKQIREANFCNLTFKKHWLCILPTFKANIQYFWMMSYLFQL